MLCDLCQQDTVTELEQLKYQLTFQYRIDKICRSCRGKFSLIEGNTCRGCGRSLEKQELCADCLQWRRQAGCIVQSQAIYHYDEQMAAFFAAYKFQSGYHLRYTFTKAIRQRLRLIRYDTLVPIPVSASTLNRRGFDHVQGLFTGMRLCPLLLCRQPSKTSLVQQGREARLKTRQPFIINPASRLDKGQHICVVDDVYTTGRTMRHAMLCLKEAGYRVVQGLTLAR